MRGGQVGFFDKAVDPVSRPQRGTLFDIAEAGFGAIRLNTEGHQMAGFGQFAGLAHGHGKRGFIEDQMVGGHHQQLGVVAKVLLHMQRRHGNRRCRVAAEGLQQQVQGQLGLVHQTVVIQGAKQQVTVGDGEHVFHTGQAAGAQEGFLQQALAIAHVHERLGHVLPGHWPQSGARTAGNDAGN